MNSVKINQQSDGSAELTTTDALANDRAQARVLDPNGITVGTYLIRFSMLVARSGPVI